ncbi:CD109 antigen, partial [Camelus dromedarius]
LNIIYNVKESGSSRVRKSIQDQEAFDLDVAIKDNEDECYYFSFAGGMQFWVSSVSKLSESWQPSSLDIEVAAYALLSHFQQHQAAEGVLIMRWLSAQIASEVLHLPRLSAFVLQCFLEADPYIDIDQNVLHRTYTWLKGRQKSSGEFCEPGRVIHSELQGGNNSPVTLTAYIVTSFLGYKKYQDKVSLILMCRSLSTEFDRGISDNYMLALVTYALSSVRSPKAKEALNMLTGRAEQEGNAEACNSGCHHCPNFLNPDSQAPWILKLRRMLCCHTSLQHQAAKGIPIMRWLSTQRNSLGGFTSTQLAVVQPMAVNISASGFGFAICQLNIIYNLKESGSSRVQKSIQDQEAFDLDVAIKDNEDDINHLDLNVCTRFYQWEASTDTNVHSNWPLLSLSSHQPCRAFDFEWDEVLSVYVLTLLPKFEVALEIPLYYSLNAESLNGTITAKLQLHRDNVHSGGKINGSANFSFNEEEMKTVMDFLDEPLEHVYPSSPGPVEILATVTESFTGLQTWKSAGISRNASSNVFFKQHDYIIEFFDYAAVLKPSQLHSHCELVYFLMVKVTHSDGHQLTPEERSNHVVITATQRNYTEKLYWSRWDRTDQEIGTVQVTNHIVPQNGIFKIEFQILDDCSELQLKASFLDSVDSIAVHGMFKAPSKTYIQLKTRDENIKVPLCKHRHGPWDSSQMTSPSASSAGMSRLFARVPSGQDGNHIRREVRSHSIEGTSREERDLCHEARQEPTSQGRTPKTRYRGATLTPAEPRPSGPLSALHRD